VLPHFSGAGTPLLDTTSRAAILGMSFATTQADIAKAILEGLTFEYRTNLDLLKDTGSQLLPSLFLMFCSMLFAS